MLKPDITAFFDPATSTYSYVVRDPSSRACAIVDPVLDYDPAAGRTSHASAERLIAHVRQHDLQVEWLLETHVHADHLSAAIFLQRELGGRLAIGARITQVQAKFSGLFNLGEAFPVDGRQFEHLFEDGESFRIGALECRALHTPGHTPACMTYLVGDSAFVGDTLFMPDYGTARCDFPGGDARTLYRSINKVLSLPADTRLYMCHDYQPGGRELLFMSTVADERASNIHVRDGVSEDEFVAMRQARDATLSMPTLILPSVQVNMRAGEMPPPEANGTRYLKIPINAL